MEYDTQKLYAVEARAAQLLAVTRDCIDRIDEARKEFRRIQTQVQSAEKSLLTDGFSRRNGGRISVGLRRALDAAKAELTFLEMERDKAVPKSQAAEKVASACRKFIEENGGLVKPYSPLDYDRVSIHTTDASGRKQVRQGYR